MNNQKYAYKKNQKCNIGWNKLLIFFPYMITMSV